MDRLCVLATDVVGGSIGAALTHRGWIDYSGQGIPGEPFSGISG